LGRTGSGAQEERVKDDRQVKSNVGLRRNYAPREIISSLTLLGVGTPIYALPRLPIELLGAEK